MSLLCLVDAVLNASELIPLGPDLAAELDYLRDYVGEIRIDRQKVEGLGDQLTCATAGVLEDAQFALGPATERLSSGYCQWDESLGLARRISIATWASWSTDVYLRIDTFADASCETEVTSSSALIGPFSQGLDLGLPIVDDLLCLETRSITRCFTDDQNSKTLITISVSVLDDPKVDLVYVAPVVRVQTSVLPVLGRRSLGMVDSAEAPARDLADLITLGQGDCSVDYSPLQISLAPVLTTGESCVPLGDNATRYALVSCQTGTTQGSLSTPNDVSLFSDADCTIAASTISGDGTGSGSCFDFTINSLLHVQVMCMYAVEESAIALLLSALAPTPQPTLSPVSTPVATPTMAPTALSAPTPNPTAGSAPTPNPTAGSAPTPNPTVGSAPTPNPTAGSAPTPNPTAGSAPTPNPTAGSAAPTSVAIPVSPAPTITSSLAPSSSADNATFAPSAGPFFDLGRSTSSPTFVTNFTNLTYAPTFAPTPGVIAVDSEVSGPPPIAAVATLCVLLAAAAYVMITSRKKKRLQKDAIAADLEETLPQGSKVAHRGTLSLFGMSVSLFRTKMSSPGEASSADSESSPESNASSGETTLVSEDDEEDFELEDSYKIRDPSLVTVGVAVEKGGFGRIYHGSYQGSRVVIKVVHCGPGSKRGAREAFTNEVRCLQVLQHPNVVRLFGVAKPSPSVRHLVLERAECTLDSILRGGGSFGSGVTIVTLLQWMEQTCAGCEFVHSKGIVHMDLKPSNILLDASWHVKLADFGAARSSTSLQAAATSRGEDNAKNPLPGSPAYMAPERWTAASTLTPSVDVYAFGMILWQALHRDQDGPFPVEWTLLAAIEAVQEGYRPMLCEEIPPGLAKLVRACWDSEADLRPPFGEVRAMVSGLLGARAMDSSSSAAAHRTFELGQCVAVWDSASLRFVGLGVVAENPDYAYSPCVVDLGWTGDGKRVVVDPNSLL